MPTCKKCQTKFPNRLVVDGVIHNISRRKYCTSCSPLGKHNTGVPGEPRIASGQVVRTCPLCDGSYGTKGSICMSCQSNSRRFEVKNRCLDYLGNKCSACGYSKCPAALVFHHKDPTQKDFSLSGNHGRAWLVIQAEIDKCVLLCSNCHLELHWLEGAEKRNRMLNRVR